MAAAVMAAAARAAAARTTSIAVAGAVTAEAVMRMTAACAAQLRWVEVKAERSEARLGAGRGTVTRVEVLTWVRR